MYRIIFHISKSQSWFKYISWTCNKCNFIKRINLLILLFSLFISCFVLLFSDRTSRLLIIHHNEKRSVGVNHSPQDVPQNHRTMIHEGLYKKILKNHISSSPCMPCKNLVISIGSD